jgi:hypothetical protein
VPAGWGSRHRKGDPSRLCQRNHRVRRVEPPDQTACQEPDAHAGAQRQSAGAQPSRGDQASPESRGAPFRGVAPRRQLTTGWRGAWKLAMTIRDEVDRRLRAYVKAHGVPIWWEQGRRVVVNSGSDTVIAREIRKRSGRTLQDAEGRPLWSGRAGLRRPRGGCNRAASTPRV